MMMDDSRRTIRATRRLTVCLILTVGGVTFGSAATASAPSPGAPGIYVNPLETTLAQFTQIDIWLNGDYDYRFMTVRLRNTQVASGYTDGSGNYVSGDVPVPPGAAACGSDEVDWYYGESWIDSANVMVYCPKVEVTPDPVSATGGTDSFTVNGSGYPADRAVTFTLDGSQTPFDSTYSDPNGRFTKASTTAALPCGTHQLTATAQPPVAIQSVRAGQPTLPSNPPLPASTTFTVTGCTTPPPPPPQRGTPKITANPDVIPDGMLTHVTGTGFPANGPVTLVWATVAGSPLMLCSPDAISAPQLSADANGNIDTYCMAPPHELFGAVEIGAVASVATPAALFGTNGIHVAAPVVVEGGSMQPSSGGDQFVFRR